MHKSKSAHLSLSLFPVPSGLSSSLTQSRDRCCSLSLSPTPFYPSSLDLHFSPRSRSLLRISSSFTHYRHRPFIPFPQGRCKNFSLSLSVSSSNPLFFYSFLETLEFFILGRFRPLPLPPSVFDRKKLSHGERTAGYIILPAYLLLLFQFARLALLKI